MFEKETSYKSLASVHKIFFLHANDKLHVCVTCKYSAGNGIAAIRRVKIFWGTTDQGQFSHWRDHIAAPIYVVIYYAIIYDIAVNMMPL